MTIPESESLWLRHLSGERLTPREEQRLLRLIEEQPELKEALLDDREMDSLLRLLDRSRRTGDGFLRNVAALVRAEHDRPRFMSRFRDRLKREGGRPFRNNTTRRLARVAAPGPAPSPGPKLAIIAAELLIGVCLLIGYFAGTSEPPKSPPVQARRPAVEEPAPVPAEKPEPAPPSAAVPVPAEPAPLDAAPKPERTRVFRVPGPAPAPVERPRAQHETLAALAVLDQVEGDAYVVGPDGLVPARIGHDLLPGRGLTTVGPRSRLGLKYPDSTRVEIGGDTIVRELSAGPGKRVALSQGVLAVRAAPQPPDAPMELHTPAARITVVGTRFSVACDTDGTRVDVDEGLVRMDRPFRDERVDIDAGECGVASAERLWAARRVKTWTLPPDWKGARAESAQGNPYRVESRPTWRLDQLWPDDPLKVENYTPLVWNGRLWHASDQASGGQPSAETSETALGLGLRMWWPDQLGNKISSLAFVAPAEGLYAVEGLVRTQVGEGGTQQPLLLQILTMDRKEKLVTPAATIPLATPRFLELRGPLLPLKAQQEILLVPQFPERGRVACTVLFEGLRITRLAPKS